MVAGRHLEKWKIAISHTYFDISSTNLWHIFTKFSVLVPTDSPQHAVTSFWGYNKIQDGGRPPFRKTENRNNSAAIWAIVTKFRRDGRHGQCATCRNAIFELNQNPRWRPAPFWKNGKSQKLDSYLRCLHKFFSKTANIIYKNCKQFILATDDRLNV